MWQGLGQVKLRVYLFRGPIQTGEIREGCLKEVPSELRLQRREELSRWGGGQGVGGNTEHWQKEWVPSKSLRQPAWPELNAGKECLRQGVWTLS